MTRTLAVLTVLAVLAALPASAQEATPLVPRHLDLELSVDYANGTIDGVAEWTVENVGPEAADRVPLQLGRLMSATGVRSNGVDIPFAQDVVTYEDWSSRQVTQVVARPASPIGPGARLALSVRYSGHLVPYAETGMRYVRDRVDSAFTILRAESFAFPQVAVASSAANRRAPRGDFSYRLRLAIPSGLVPATGVPPSARQETAGTATWTFESEEPVPFLNVAVAPYRTTSSGGLAVYHFPADSAGARQVLSAMVDALALYGTWFGELEGAAVLHVIEIPEGWGSQASLRGGIIQTADAFRDPAQLPQLYHELAHLWHPPDLDRPAPRWNEGLATFLQHRVADARDDPGTLRERMEALAVRQVERVAGDPELARLPMVDYGRDGATGLSYGTGALMSYALYRTLGADAFDALLRDWFRDLRGDGSTTAQFADRVRRAGPGASAILDEWLFSTRWHERLASGETLADLIEGYRRRG